MELGVVIVVIVVLFGFGSRSREPSKRWGAGSRVQTRGANLRLRLGSPLAITGARLRIQLSRHRRLLVADEHSLLVVGPTRSGKTTRVVLPNLCSFTGSLVATSVKTDLLAAEVLQARERRGRLVIIGDQRLATHRWDPTCEAVDDRQAAAIAHALVLAQPSFGVTSGDTQFWYQLAEPIVAGALRASQLTGAPMLGWMDDPGELYRSLNTHGAHRLAEAVLAICAMEDRQRDSVLLTARGLLAPLAHGGNELPTIRVAELLEGESSSTFLVASAAEQEFLSLLFSLLLSRIVAAALESRREHPLLLCLDELANLAPIPNLDRLAAIGVGQGVRLISIVQDLAQLESRYGRSANSIINNHASKLFMSPTSDPITRSYLRDMAPDALASRYPMFMEGSRPMVRLLTYSKTRA
ncbi:type IV secretory system conjugative DNA transfer family protein [Ferrimicrobium acidiphilum]|uniref:type IV secretory system conjugative DNA transfer family protein n=1 Tax=Ferrimicrobium acidiphilum TaxID=121039 RepID=UPI0023EF9ECD|nr:type IV secretory system conjugative DNA transfer family protein [Ferrimicrobium acidiphilum]